MIQIKLSNILPLSNPKEFKLHCAVWNGEKKPLDVFASDREEWHGWNRYKGKQNWFNRRYVFSLIRFYPEDDSWLFGGIYEVLSIIDNEYEIEESELGQKFVGRLKLSLKLSFRNRRVNLENHYDSMIVTEILREPYTGMAFPGYEDINIGFEQLEVIYKNQREDWHGHLKNIQGIYLITDKSNGKKYVGSAYNDTGIWSRWQSYIETGHGWNVELTKLVNKEGMGYAKKNFSFTLLEYRSMRTDKEVVKDREQFWKKVLLSRGDYGYNKN